MTTNKRKLLILNADDAGLCRSVNYAVIELLERGVLCSTSVIVPAPGFEHFVGLMHARGDRSCGIHLTLNSEWRHYRWTSILPCNDVPSLVDAQGFMHRHVLQTFTKVKARHAEREFRAQIETAIAAGLQVTHLDSHMGCYELRPDLFSVVKKLAVEYGLPMRVAVKPRNIWLKMQGYVVNDHFYNIRTIKGERYDTDLRFQQYLRRFRRLKPGVTDISVHPSLEDKDIKRITGTWYRRVNDYKVMLKPEILTWLSQLDTHLTDYAQIKGG